MEWKDADGKPAFSGLPSSRLGLLVNCLLVRLDPRYRPISDDGMDHDRAEAFADPVFAEQYEYLESFSDREADVLLGLLQAEMERRGWADETAT